MPKIRLSALVTDMKGKAGGSVFSKNKGGNYFRNNPNGGGRKSQVWDSQKNLFGSLATRWKSLTEEQQQAWNDAAVLYPTLNAWSESYLPSGYQLYMKLNGSLLSAGLSSLNTPQSPREFPVQPTMDVFSPDLYQFQPRKVVKFNFQGGIKRYLYNGTFFDEANMTSPITLSCNFMPDRSFKTPPIAGDVIPLFSYRLAPSNGVGIYLYVVNSSESRIYVVSNVEDTGEKPYCHVQYTTINNSVLQSPFSLIVRKGFGATYVSDVYLNSVLLTTDFNYWYDKHYNDPKVIFTLSSTVVAQPTLADYSDVTSPLAICRTADYGTSRFYASDFRYINAANGNPGNCCEGTECGTDMDCYQCECTLSYDKEISCVAAWIREMSLGYVLGFETAIVGLHEATEGFFPNVMESGSSMGLNFISSEDCENDEDCGFSDEACVDGCCVYVGDEWYPGEGPSQVYAPWVLVSPYSVEGENYNVNIYATGPISAGKSPEQVPYKLVGSYPVNGASIDLTQRMFEMFGSFSGGCAFTFKAYLMDTTTGVVSGSQIPMIKRPKAKKVIRFKAGSELSSSMN